MIFYDLNSTDKGEKFFTDKNQPLDFNQDNGINEELKMRSYILLVLASVFGFWYSGIADEVRNLVPNPGFEEGLEGDMPKGWQKGKHYGKIPPGATFQLDETTKFKGNKSLRISSISDDIPTIVQSDPIAVEAGEKYVLSMYLKGDRESVNARLFALAANYKHNVNTEVTVTNEWKRYKILLNVPKNNNQKYWVRFDLMDKGTLWADDISLAKFDPDNLEDSEFTGYRERSTPGGKEVKIQVGGPTGITFPNINGVCFCYGFGAENLDPRFKELNLKVVRIHNVLTNYRIIKKDDQGKLNYDFKLLDQVIDRTLEIGAVPEMNLCFVPLQLVENPDPKKIRKSYDGFYLGPPSDYGKWEEFIFNVVKHCQDKYQNITDWYWIFGNEPSVEKQFSMGTEDDYYQLYKHTLNAAIKVNPKIKIGAGSFASQIWLKHFVRRCGEEKTRLDLISWHHYNLVPEDYAKKIAAVRKLVADFPGLGNPELIIDEWNPRLPDNAPAYLAAGDYAAAQTVASIYEMMKAKLSYQTFFISHSVYNWGMMGKKGEKHPTFNAMAMLAMMGPEEIKFISDDKDPYVGGFATRKQDGSVTVLVWYAKYFNDISRNFNKNITIDLPAVQADAKNVQLYFIDKEHSNGLENPQRQELETRQKDVTINNNADGDLEVKYPMVPNSVALLVVKPK